MDAVALVNVHAGYDGHPVLRGLTLTIGSGQRVGLVGPNGAGKTTLLHLLLGLHRAESGTVRVLGLDAGAKRDVAMIRRRAALVFQNADDQLFSGTVLDDVAFGPLNLGLDDATARHRAMAALGQVGAAETADRISHHLSAGEKRRVALAAVLAMQPELLILDEPTSELDPRGRRAVIALLNALPHTRLVATHDLEFVRESCERVIVLDAGQVAADGAAEVVLSDAGLMDRVGLEVPHSLRRK